MNTGIDFAILKQALVRWVEAVLGDEINGTVWYPWPNTKMAKPYVMLRLVGPHKIGRDNFDGSNLGGQRRFTVTVNAYAENPNLLDQAGGGLAQAGGAIELVNRLQTSLEDPNIVDLLYGFNVGIGEIMDANDLSEVLDTKYENRAAFDFFIFTAQNVPTDAGQITSAEVENDIIPEV